MQRHAHACHSPAPVSPLLFFGFVMASLWVLCPSEALPEAPPPAPSASRSPASSSFCLKFLPQWSSLPFIFLTSLLKLLQDLVNESPPCLVTVFALVSLHLSEDSDSLSQPFISQWMKPSAKSYGVKGPWCISLGPDIIGTAARPPGPDIVGLGPGPECLDPKPLSLPVSRCVAVGRLFLLTASVSTSVRSELRG